MKQKKSFLCRHNRCLNTAKAICVSFLFSIPAGTAVAAVHAAEVDIVQQNETVKGTVLDEQGIPVIGANVKVVGTTVGAITDLDGNFSINAPKGAKIEVSFIGYVTQVVTAPSRGALKVVLREDAQLLEEVVAAREGPYWCGIKCEDG